jgi:transcription elongation factor Elf1
MYTKGRDMKEEKPKPFTVICNHCGSHQVIVTAIEYYDLSITCLTCGAHLGCGSYYEKDYKEEQ